MQEAVRVLKETPSQTAGPYVHIGLTPNAADVAGVYDRDLGATMLTPDTRGDRIRIVVRVFDGAGAAVTDAVVEIWQADTEGSYAAPMGPSSNSAPSFTGWGRQATDADGAVTFETVKPGRVIGPDDALMAPHVSLWIVARGINIGLQTRLYFEDEAEANAGDTVLRQVPDARRHTLISAKQAGVPNCHAFDIRLQGDAETVFFDV